MEKTLDESEFQARLQRLDVLLRETQHQADPAVRARFQEIVQAVLEMHAVALKRLLDYVAEAGEAGRGILHAASSDGVVGGLLLLHGLHPIGLEERVRQALEIVQPYLRSHGGCVELQHVRDGVVRLRLQGNCHHCPSSALTMQQTVEEAIYSRAPEVSTIEVEGIVEESSDQDLDGARLALPVV
jgi:Fe-S cluster biogenesis protein NfuA